MKKHPIKTHPMWNPKEPTYADVSDVVGKAFAAGLPGAHAAFLP